ncbi:MAG TPA: ATP-binding protein, partial [Rhizobacter sp.]|nr:ATP-binding protein [Rhizobacter sp.]
DLVINKPLGLSPKHIEFKRAHLYDINPVGLGAMLSAAVLAIVAYAGALGPEAEAFAPFIALVTAMLLSPLLAWATRGRYYLARRSATRWSPGQSVVCSVCDNAFESEDMAHCPAYDAPICSLCCTLESRCHDRCKTNSRAAEQVSSALATVLPASLAGRVNSRVAHYLVVLASLIGLLGVVLGVVYDQQGVLRASEQFALQAPFIKVFALLSLAAAVGAWWVVLGSESRHMAQDESNRQNQLLTREIEAHQRTDAALQAAKDLAEAANQAKTRYVAGMTHELRTPLNSILGYAQILLKDERVQGARRASVATIHRSGEHLHGLIDGLLDLARIEAGRLRLDPAPLPVHEFLDDLVRMVAPQAEAKGLSFKLETSGRIPDHVNADAKRLRQILINLLSNAVRFTDHGSVTLRLDHRREVARFEVIDTGIGIAAQDQERIFLPCERGSAGRRTGDSGTGLGLTITHLLTQLMGGELTVKSTPGMGSTFTARLYLREIAAPTKARLTHRPVTGYLGARRTLLVVDDQPTQRQMLVGLLMPLGFQIREAASGRECLEGVIERCPDAVLLDISMDDMDGWQTAREIRAAGFADVPIIMVSANAFENQPAKLEEAGCHGFVDKPVIESELLAALQRHLQIEWLAELALPAWSGSVVSEEPTERLPATLVGDLVRLARLGHVQGLRSALDAAVLSHSACQAELQRLGERLDRFDLEGFLEQLVKNLQGADVESPL